MIAITGATGAVGGRIAARLAKLEVPQRLIVRDRVRAPALSGAEIAEFGGYVDRDGMKRACEGVDTLFLASASEAPDRVDQHRVAVDAAVAGGVTRIVYLSFLAAAPDCTFTFARDHFHTEQHIRASGAAFTFSRQSIYLDFLPMMVGPDDVIRGPAGNGRFAPVHRDDVADAIVAMLTDESHAGTTYDLTGPEAVTMAEVADAIGAVSGRAVTYEEESLADARASRASSGAPDWEIEGWITTYAAIGAGELDIVTDHVRRLTGREPISPTSYFGSGELT